MRVWQGEVRACNLQDMYKSIGTWVTTMHVLNGVARFGVVRIPMTEWHA